MASEHSEQKNTPAARSGASRVMAVLDALASADPAVFPDGMSVADVARVLGREKSVVSRQLKSLLETGMVARRPSMGYELSWRLFALAVRAGDQRLTTLAAPLLLRLTETVRERTYLSVLSDGEVLTVLSEGSRRSIEAVNWVGRTIPAHRSSSGMALLMDYEDEHILDLVRRGEGGSEREAKAFLAQVKEARVRGYTVANRIFDPELVGIGAPVRDFTGRIKAAVNISGPAFRIEPHIQSLAGHLLATTRTLHSSLGSDARPGAGPSDL
ncbi:IclR family transcriptional regulator [Streptomyces drozdowiczii]|uniref:Helix-turn-helix domain-containing protein n=1 Tax=Streptomyces drozdowiczii TaxID=202862 RepID=A0ABY6PNV8_9ACTN|nr:IclR family transcriptional regulator C-terminal domain-containing protein [Streptomyces drozdowiczii]MCX0246653.1 helix-turn-helix domain-containing protein [Streptomyces drozdowiczii]UZK53870.1 helix-turn-helix domain-containing protein [Streptomyces drozdowiczii]